MKTFLITLLAVLFFSHFLFSQSNKPPHKILIIITNGVNGKDLLTHDLIINSFDIEKLDLLNIAEVRKKYGDDSLKVAVKITPKSSVKLIGLADFYRLHNINNSNPTFFISQDGQVMKGYKDMLIEDEEVKSVELKNDTLIIGTKMGYARLMKAKKNAQ